MNVISIDIEATNRCNAVCHFCPRDATPHQGHMSMETFEQTLLRAVELREYNAAHSPSPVLVVPNICGLGEPLLNPNTPEFIRRIRAAGFDRCTMASNGSLLDKKRGAAVLDAGVTRVNINISDLGEDYEDIYNLPFETTRDNIIRFVEDSRGYCEVQIVLVNHHKDGEHIARMKAFWRDHGVDGFMVYEVMNRGGALFVEHMQYDQLPEFQILCSHASPIHASSIKSSPFFIGANAILASFRAMAVFAAVELRPLLRICSYNDRNFGFLAKLHAAI